MSNFFNVLNDLNLKLNSKLTLKKARIVDNHTLNDDELISPNKIPDYILKTLMIVNYHAREFKLKPVTSDNDDAEDNESDNDEDEDVEGMNPMDALTAIFHCSDIFLRRDLAIKLSACQLSVPFLLPNPENPSEDVAILLSALEGIRKMWKGGCDDNVRAQEVFATQYPFPVVSFIRIGKNTMSKSSLMNKIMCDAIGDHYFFFHKGIKGGDVERKIVDGLVEVSWYLPGGSEEQTLKKEICFANLRGDAQHFKKQLNVLSKISSVFCILLPSEKPDNKVREILDQAALFKAQTILIFDNESQACAKEFFSELRNKHSKKLSLITKSKKRNEHGFIQSIRKLIQKYILAVKEVPLVELASSVNQLGIHLDGSKSHLEWDETVDTTWLQLEAKDAKSLFKLQTHVPVLASLEREKYCPDQKSNKPERMDEIYRSIKEETKSQKKSLDVMDKRIVQFLNCIAMMDDSQRNYTLAKLKHQLNMMSMQVMAKLHGERKPRQNTSDALPSEHLNQLEESITKCSFGLEHVIRELAQLYLLTDISTVDYAGAAAKMLLSGHSLELVDGHSSYIPIRWLKAVYTKLERETYNAKIFVISVLGIQSSGKSTMLNTMFGLDFPVSAGRCTRGAFATLIPVSDASNFDYVLIIDTEGLRGSGDPELRKHDNKLATFAIGVADLTIVNIFGENHNEIKEFLEIAVHAFLKMKLVKDKKACKIVHQNVSATNATDKLIVDRLKLRNDLDKMTKLAATQENCEDKFQQLNDIISFDENEDVFYIPSLLKGSPPMAPVNPEYGRAVQRVKENIIAFMCSIEHFQLSVSQFRERVCNLWEAMLKENFIFSFRNTIEVRAYTSLDRKYFEVFVTLMVKGMTELDRKIEVAIKRCTTQDELKARERESTIQIHDEAETLGKEMENAMKQFFETSEDKTTLEQWRENVMNKIKQDKEIQMMQVKKNCLANLHHWENRQKVEEKKQTYRKELIQKANEFITSAQSTKDADKFTAEFKHKWQEWIKDVPQCQESKIDVNSEMVNVLCHTDPRLNAKMTEKLRMQDFSILKFKEIPPVIDVDELQISSQPHWAVTNVRVRKFISQQRCLFAARNICDQAEKEGIDFAKTKSRSGARCGGNVLTQLYHKVITIIEENSKKCNVKFYDCLKCDVVLNIFANAYEIFHYMEEYYLKERDIRGELEGNLRPELESYFVNLCSEMEKEVLAASSIVDVLKKPIESELNRTMGPAVARKILTDVNEYKSKGQFHASALIQLGKEGKFESFIPYLENPVNFLRNHLMKSIESYCLNHENASCITTLLTNEAKYIADKVFDAIGTANDQTGGKLTIWIERFVQDCATLDITREMFAVATIVDEVKNIYLFGKTVREKLKQFLESLVQRGVDRDAMKTWNPSPHDHLFSLMFGCQNCCPFCKVLCDHTQDHPGREHSTQLHRPQCLNRFRHFQTKKLDTTICTTWVATEQGRFYNEDTSREWHLFKDYKTVNDYYKTWLIPPDPTFEASIYWQWFVATFSKELAKLFHAKQPDIPVTWKSRSFEEAEEQLRQQYKI